VFFFFFFFSVDGKRCVQARGFIRTVITI